MSAFWQQKSVVVTGGGGFLGTFVVERLRREGANVVAPRSAEFDLVDGDAVHRLIAAARPAIRRHANGVVDVERAVGAE